MQVLLGGTGPSLTDRFLGAFGDGGDIGSLHVPPFLGIGLVFSVALFLAVLLIGDALQIQQVVNTLPNTSKSYQQMLWENEIIEMTRGYPIAQMLPEIFQYDHATAAYIIGIGKKESNWGKVSPTQYDQDCYNYWGYTAPGSKGIAAGHGCFGTREEAVESVASQLQVYLYEYQYQTPRQLVVWKCGFTCVHHDPISVKKWIDDVAYYTNELVPTKRN